MLRGSSYPPALIAQHIRQQLFFSTLLLSSYRHTSDYPPKETNADVGDIKVDSV